MLDALLGAVAVSSGAVTLGLLMGLQQAADVAGDELRVLVAAVDAPPNQPRAVQAVVSLPVLRVGPRRHAVVADQPVAALKSFHK